VHAAAKVIAVRKVIAGCFEAGAFPLMVYEARFSGRLH